MYLTLQHCPPGVTKSPGRTVRVLFSTLPFFSLQRNKWLTIMLLIWLEATFVRAILVAISTRLQSNPLKSPPAAGWRENINTLPRDICSAKTFFLYPIVTRACVLWDFLCLFICWKRRENRLKVFLLVENEDENNKRVWSSLWNVLRIRFYEDRSESTCDLSAQAKRLTQNTYACTVLWITSFCLL